MALDVTVKNHQQIGSAGKWNGIATSCHFATIYWMILDMGRYPTQNTFISLNYGQLQVFMSTLLRKGNRRLKPLSGNLVLTPGSILIFARDREAKHSCVAIEGQVAGGYNQLGWWTEGGKDHQYTDNKTMHLRWGTGTKRSKSQYAAEWHDLYEISPEWAKGQLRARLGW